MRARNIKPAFFQNELLTEVDFAGRLLFIGLWTLADREGRLEDRPKRIKMQLFAMDDVDVNASLDELARHGFIQRYQRDGGEFIQIINFKKHQRPHNNESESVIPPPIEDTTSNHGEQDVQPRSEALRSESPFTDSLNADTGMRNPEIAAAPRKPKPVPKPTEVDRRNPLWDALAEETGSPATKNERSDFGETVSQLKAANATVDEIHAFPHWWYESFPGATLTHRCYRDHLGKFRSAPPRPMLPSDIKNPGIRALVETRPEEYDAIRAEVRAKNGRPHGVLADPRRNVAGGQEAQHHVLPPPVRMQRD